MNVKYKEFSGYILAGGKSSRMGRDKAFLEIRGKTFLENAVDILKPVFEDRIKIILNQNQKDFVQKLPNSTSHIFDIYQNRGPVGGIHAALSDCVTKYAVVLAVDQPFVSREILLDLIKTIVREKSDVAIPVHENGVFEQLTSVYRVKNALPTLEKLLKSPDSISVLKFVESLEKFASLKFERSSKEFDNINKPADFRRISS